MSFSADHRMRAGDAVRALLGTEAMALSEEELRAFYSSRYLEQNPTLDFEDVPTKFSRLTQVSMAAGLTRATRIIEVGCGSGALLHSMQSWYGAQVAVGVDYSLGTLNEARNHTSAALAVARGTELPYRSGSFDLVYFADVLEHVLRPTDFLRELTRIAERVLFLIPLEAGLLASPMYLVRRARGRPTNFDRYGHIWRWTRPQVSKMFREAGLVIESSRVFHHPITFEGKNVKGVAMERLRSLTMRVSPVLAEAVFGITCMVGLATRTKP